LRRGEPQDLATAMLDLLADHGAIGQAPVVGRWPGRRVSP